MEINELFIYQMTQAECEKWSEVQDIIHRSCKVLNIPETYHSIIENATQSRGAYHLAGFCETEGYYFVEEGDRGELHLACKTFSLAEICSYIMHHRILYAIGTKMELQNRSELEQRWKYRVDNKNCRPRHLPLIENSNYQYHTRYDSRKMWFEYIINNLAVIFDEERVEKVIEEYTGYMNRWFDDKHWEFDKTCKEFIEISDSVEHD